MLLQHTVIDAFCSITLDALCRLHTALGALCSTLLSMDCTAHSSRCTLQHSSWWTLQRTASSWCTIQHTALMHSTAQSSVCTLQHTAQQPLWQCTSMHHIYIADRAVAKQTSALCVHRQNRKKSNSAASAILKRTETNIGNRISGR